MSVLSLPAPASPVAAPAFAPGARKLASPGRPVERAVLAHHLAVLPLPARTLALVTGNAPGELPADAALVRWVASRLRALSTSLVAGEPSPAAFRREVAGLAALGPGPAPAGEEILVGLTAAARRLGPWRLLPEAGLAALLAALAATGSGRDASGAQRALDDAARGGFAGPVAALVDLLGDAEAEDGALKEAALRLAAGGSRPGADTLAGIVAVVRDVALGAL